jgi:two-component system, LytTR family, sensor kinase
VTTNPGNYTLRRAALVTGAWTLFGVLSALQIYVRERAERGGATLHGVFNIVYFYWAWAVTTPLILRLSAAMTRDGRSRWRRVWRHLPLILAILTIQAICYAVLGAIDGRVAVDDIGRSALSAAIRHLPGNLLTLATIVGAHSAFQYYRQTRDQLLESSRLALRASELESSLTRMRLESLRTQLQPHFLFNTLNMISGLVTKGDIPSANRAIARLGDLLRAALSTSAEQTVPLQQELDMTRRYLEIARLRFGDRLTVHEDVDASALGVLVPSLILQPLVENAIQHGISTRDSGGSVWVEIVRESDDALTMTVRDDGPGFANAGRGAERGLGLSNARDRLAHLYGAAGGLTAGNAPNGGAVVTVRIPVVTAHQARVALVS